MSDRVLQPGQRVVWVVETAEAPVGSRASYEEPLRTEPRQWLVHAEEGTETGIDYSETQTFSDADAAVAAARRLGDLVLVRSLDPIEGHRKFSAGAAAHPWPAWPR